MRHSISAVALAAVCVTGGAALANDEGLYGYLGAGYNQPLDSDLGDVVAGDIEYDAGLGVLGAIGYDYGDYFRTELELGLRTNDVDDVENFDGGLGDTDVFTAMANMIFTAPVSSAFEPYIGGGVGIGRIERDVSATGLDLDDDDVQLAYQGIAGVAFKVAESLALDVSYRYLRLEDQDIVTPAGEVEAEYAAHGVFGGLRWNFGSPAAPAPRAQAAPAPAPTPAPALAPVDAVAEDLEIIVYFDLNSSVLTAQADALIQQAASTALSDDINAVVVSGHTDTSGSTAYNQVLSEKRSAVVQEALVRYGVPATMIRSSALGESAPAVATGDGVREPLNRRTEVSITFE